MKKQLDTRIKTLIENGVKQNQRSIFVVLGKTIFYNPNFCKLCLTDLFLIF